MRARSVRFLSFVAPLAAAPLAFAALAACVNTPPVVPLPDDSGVNPPGDGSAPRDGAVADGTTPGDGTAPEGDAASDAAAAKDGQAPDGATSLDGGSLDAGAADGALPASGPITVVVATANGPEPGVPVLFQDVTGAVVATGTTDATGSVKETVATGSGVTAVLGTLLAPSLVTVLAVEPGDVLAILDPSVPPAGANNLVTATSLPGSSPDGATFAMFAGTCEGTATAPPVSLSLAPGCVAGGTFPLLVLAEDATPNELAFAFQKQNAAIVDAGAADDGGPVEIDLTVGGTWATSTPLTLSALHAPVNPVDGALVYGEIAGGVAYVQTTSIGNAVNAVDAGAPPEATFRAHTGYPDFVQAEVNAIAYDPNVVGGSQNGNVLLAVATRAAAASPPPSVDFANALPTVISSTVAFDDVTRPTLSWTTSAPATSAAGTVSVLSWQSTVDDGGTQAGTWTIVSPATTTTLQAPSLGALAARGPSGTGVSWQGYVIAMLSGTFLPTYASLRATSASFWSPASSLLTGYSERALIPPLPANGTLQVSAVVPFSD